MKDIGVSCQKKSYGRGVGHVLECTPGLENNIGLCYPHCKAHFRGNGPVCWEDCPNGMKSCGALCVNSDGQCTDVVKDTVKDVVTLAANIVK